MKTTAPNVTERMPRGARNGHACEAISLACHRRRNLLAIAKRRLAKGYPTWAALPEPMRWQIIAYIDQQEDSHGCGLLPARVSTTPHPRPGIPSRRTTGSLVQRTCMLASSVSAFVRTPPKIAEDLFDFVRNPESPEKPDATCVQAKTRLESDGRTLGALH